MSQGEDKQQQDPGHRPGVAPPETASIRRPNYLKGAIVAGVSIVVIYFGIVWWCNRDGGIREHSARMSSANNLKSIGLGIHNYHDVHLELPANSHRPDGTPLLSWRVHILPFIEGDNLHKRFHLDEPWDGPNNRELLDEMPKVYASPKSGVRERYKLTYYRGFSNPGAIFERHTRPFTFDAIKGGLGNTIFVVEAGEAVEWTRPDDLDASLGKPLPALGGMHWRNGSFQAMMGDGAVRKIPVDVAEDKLRALISHSGGETVTPD